jgi:hypothetical protein
MESPKEIQDIAEERLNEAFILSDNGKFDGAFYLLGYAVELELKAKICELLNIPNLFSEQDSSRIQEKGFSRIRKVFKTHNLMHLLFLCGLKGEYDVAKGKEKEIFIAHSSLFEVWSENYRYKSVGSCEPKNVKELLEVIKRVMLWIREN